jgi:hypothetical protein
LRCELLHDKSQVRVTTVHLPAINTTQFGWIKSRLPRKAQPMPPIYQPEVAAQAVVWAADHNRREIKVGLSSLLIVALNKLVPNLLDHYLARTGYESQQTDEPEDPNRPHNLWKPVPGDHGAHGQFDNQAYNSSIHLWATTHRAWLALAVGVVALSLFFI